MVAITKKELQMILEVASPQVRGKEMALACENLYQHLDKIPQALARIERLENHINGYLDSWEELSKDTIDEIIQAHIEYKVYAKIKRIMR